MGAKINHSGVIARILQACKINQLVDKVPHELAEKVVPVLVSNPEKHIQRTSGALNDGTTGTISTVSTTKKTFITGCVLSVAKSALNASLFSSVTITPVGSSASTLLLIRYEPSTVGQFTQTITFPFPIEVEKGSDLTLTNSNGTASIDTSGIVFYYEEE